MFAIILFCIQAVFFTPPLLSGFVAPFNVGSEFVFNLNVQMSLATAEAIKTDTITVGDLFITNLPDSINGLPSTRYIGIELPARSWLLNRTFFWKTSEADRGDHALWFYVFRDGDSAAPADSIAVHVIVR